MATNVKKFKYSLLCKILCALLCSITFFGAVYCGFLSFDSVTYNVENEDCEAWTDTEAFYYDVYFDASNALSTATYTNRVAEVQKIVESKRESVISQFETAYIEEYNRKLQEENADYIDMQSFLNRNMPIEIPVGAYGCGSVNFNPNISYQTNPQEVREVLEKEYDSKNNFVCLMDGVYSGRNDTGFLCYIEYENSTYGDKTVPDKLTSSMISYSLENGKVQAKGINNKLQNEISDRISQLGADKNEITVKFCIELERPESLVTAKWKTENKYLQLKEFHTLAKKVYTSIVGYSVAAIALLVASIVCGITFLKATGRNGEKAKAKLSFIDYVPIELHCALLTAIGVGVWWLAVNLLDSVGIYSVTAVWRFAIFVSFVQVLLLEFTSSVSRAIGSERKNKKFFMCYWVITGLIEIIKTIKSKIKTVFKPFSYKAKHFDRLFLAKLALFYLINIAMVVLLIYMLYEWFWLTPNFIAFWAVIFILVNFFMMRKAVSYVKDFDKIIVASGDKTEPNLDIDKLHFSLRILSENMRYNNAELQTAIAKAVKDERLRAELITNVSHDLKTPLTSIITYVDLLSKCDINDDKACEYIRVLDEKGAKLKRLIDDLIEASKVTSGNISLDITTLNLSELCLQSTTEALRDFEKNSLELIVKQGEKPTFVLADGAKTYRVIENLLSNARKYSAKHSRVYVSVYEEYGRGVFEIKNISANPLDITPDELTERFVRGDRSRNTDGNGLGLSIAKELCKAQNGELELIIDGDLFKARVLLPRG